MQLTITVIEAFCPKCNSDRTRIKVGNAYGICEACGFKGYLRIGEELARCEVEAEAV